MNAPPGRPRDASVDDRVIQAALDTIHDAGLAGLSVDGIAAKAGVSKATIYRRWASKDELVVDAIASVASAMRVPDTGNLRSDLLAFVTDLRSFMCDSRAGEVLPWLSGEVAGQTVLGKRYSSAVMAPKRAAIEQIIDQATARGEVRPDLDRDLAVDMVIGPLIMKRLSGQFKNAPESWPADLVDALLRGWEP